MANNLDFYENISPVIKGFRTLYAQVFKDLDKLSFYNTYIKKFDIRFLSPDTIQYSPNGVPYTGWAVLMFNPVSGFTAGLGDVDSLTSFNILLDEAFFSVNQTFNIVETAVKGYNGTVKEFTGQGDFSISLKAKFVGPAHWQTDTKKMEKLQYLLQNYYVENRPLQILNPELNILYNISNVVLYSYTIEQDEENGNIRYISMELKSDNDLEIIE